VTRCLIALVAVSALWSNAATAETHPWWKGAVIYEIYPRSFQDSNADGIGDLNGITSRLDYIKSLGVDAIWLTPIYPSPQVDFGYDIADYESIDPKYGTLKDFDHLVAEAKKRHIRVIMDLVLNHTSDKHPWFIESASSRNNPKRDWYVWKDGKRPGQPPNNWQSVFGHGAWQYDAKTGQYYYHKFYAQQPDLNWNNPAVQKAMYDVLHYWIKRGVGGFRLDAVTSLYEDPKLRDEPIVHDKSGKPERNAFGDVRVDGSLTDKQPGVHEVLRKLRQIVDSYKDQIVLVGETWAGSTAELRTMYGAKNDELQLPMDLQVGFIDRMDAGRFRRLINDAETGIDGNEPLFVLDSHDKARWDRYGDGVHNADIGRVFSTVIIASRGTAIYYYGDEIGMVTTPPTRKEDVRDPVGITGWPKEKGRDGERTPMQWTAAPNAGFSPPGVRTWLPIPPSSTTTNVVAQTGRQDSMLVWFQALGRLKHENAALRDGDEVMLNPADSKVLAWLRRTPKGEAVVVICNFTARPQKVSFDLKKQGVANGKVVTLLKTPGTDDPLSLAHIMMKPFGVYLLGIR
jgi:alpha-glucosidase